VSGTTTFPAADGEALRAAMRHFPSGVTVLLTDGPDGVHGMTANGVCSISLDPPLMLVTLRNQSRMKGLLEDARGFSINILRASQSDVADRFAGRPVAEAPAPSFSRLDDCPVLDGALASLACAVEQLVPSGDHTLVIARVTGIGVDSGEPLLFYQGRWAAFPGPQGVFLQDRSAFTEALNGALELDASTTALLSLNATRGHFDRALATLPVLPAAAERFVPSTARALERARQRHCMVVHASLQHPPRDRLVNPFLRTVDRLGLTLVPWTKSDVAAHGICGTPQSEFVDALAPIDGELVLAGTRRPSAFFDTALDEHLQAAGITTLLLAGVSTNTSIFHTALDAFARDYTVVVLSDCTVSFYGDDLHDLALANIRSSVGWVLTADEAFARIAAP
jgi:flavin reductase (DIM6/NTAB) family NADH-FMN oxidoreductase RutF/nicotinamidase-related amidase